MKPQTKSILFLATVLALVPNVASALDTGDGPGEDEPTPSEPPPPPGSEPPTPMPTWQKTLNNSSCFPDCSANWGAGFSVSGKLAATPKAVTGTRDKLEAWGELDGFARINGSKYSMFRVRVAGVAEAKARTDLGLTAYVAGSAIYTKPFVALSGSYTWLSGGGTWPTTFIDKSVTVAVGPIPVTFRAKATGQLAATLSGKISNIGIETAAGPSGKASLFASAAVGGQYCVWTPLGEACVGASAGLSVDVTLVEAAAPITFNLWWSLVNMGYGTQLNYGLNSNITLKTLNGYLSVFAEGCIGVCASWTSKLIDWPGWSASYGLISVNGKYCLTGTCSTVTGFQ